MPKHAFSVGDERAGEVFGATCGINSQQGSKSAAAATGVIEDLAHLPQSHAAAVTDMPRNLCNQDRKETNAALMTSSTESVWPATAKNPL